jgi:transcriptional regulator with XRE-family HTH domain
VLVVWSDWMISPYVRRLRLAAELRSLRDELGMTHTELAKRTGDSRAQISRLENGHNVDQGIVIRILDALGVTGERWTTIVTIAREAGERGWWEGNKAMGARQALYADLEAGAATIREFQMVFIPGLLQIPEFAQARGGLDALVGPVDFDAEEAVAARKVRQRVLQRPQGPHYEAIIDELAIRRAAVPPEVLKAQLYHLTARANGDADTTIRLLPIDARVAGFCVPRGAFSIYDFPDPLDPRVVAVDTITDDLVLTDDLEVKRYENLYDRLRDAALPPEESLDSFLDIAKATLP